jgi:competence protein ComEA
MVRLGARASDEQFDRLMRFLLRTWTKFNINSATAPEIAPVLDIGDAADEAVVKRRTESGSFKSLDQLKKISGLNPAKLEARKDRIIF